MFTGVKHTRSGIPVPLDSSGREMCLLFIKYGRCRFKNKCKKSHWTPPLPDEEYPKPPPLPLYPPPSSSVIDISSEGQVTSHDICMVDRQRQNLPAFEGNYIQKKYPVRFGIGIDSWTPRGCEASNSQDYFDTCQTFNQEKQESCNLYQTMVVSHFSMNQHHPGPGIQTCNTLEFSATNATMVPVCASVADLKDDVDMKLERETQGFKDEDVEFATVNANAMMGAMETALDRLSQLIYQRKDRFDFVYHPNTQAKGGGKYKSNIDQSYEKYGAYYDHAKKKLEFHHQPRNKIEKKNYKLLRKAHWNTWQELKAKLAQLPPGYSLKVDFTRVNFSRLRPYFYLLVHQCFYCADTTIKHWKPSPFSCLVAETLIAFFATGKTTAAEAEKRMQDWGARPVRVRQCISHMWSIIVKSSLSTSGVAQDVLDCEKQVFAQKVSAVDYAYACTLAGPLVKEDTSHLANRSTPTIIKSVRQGIQAVKNASLLQTKTTKLKPSRIVGNASSRTNCRAIKKVSRTLAYRANLKATGVRCKKKKTKRPQQFSLLDEEGKRELLKRCKAILEEENT